MTEAELNEQSMTEVDVPVGTITVAFRTVAPISQATGLKLWEIASHFGAKGAHSYVLTSRPAGYGSLPDAITALLGEIQRRVSVGRGGAATVPIVVNKIVAEVLQ